MNEAALHSKWIWCCFLCLSKRAVSHSKELQMGRAEGALTGLYHASCAAKRQLSDTGKAKKWPHAHLRLPSLEPDTPRHHMQGVTLSDYV